MAGRIRSIVHRLVGRQPGSEAPPADPSPDSPPGAAPDPDLAGVDGPAGVPPEPASAAEAGLAAFFEADHRRCDALWARAEAAGEGPERAAALEAFVAAVRAHLAMEEDVLFPAFEEATGMVGMGPTEVMRSEHARMRGLLDAIERAALGGAFDEALDQGDTLHLLTQQHNSKEEQVLYPMAEGHLAGRWEELRQRLARYAEGG